MASKGYGRLLVTVRHNKTLSLGARLIYAEIMALAKKQGYCWTTNKVFTETLGFSQRSISAWITELVKAGYVRAVFNHKNNLTIRHLYIVKDGVLITDRNDDSDQEPEDSYTDPSSQRSNKSKQGRTANDILADELCPMRKPTQKELDEWEEEFEITSAKVAAIKANPKKTIKDIEKKYGKEAALAFEKLLATGPDTIISNILDPNYARYELDRLIKEAKHRS